MQNKEKGHIKIVLEPLDETQSKRDNVTFKLYRIGDVKEGHPMIDSKYHIKCYPQTAEETESVSKTILKQLKDAPILTGKTDENGVLNFPDIVDGVYLIAAQNPNPYGVVTPTLLHLPYQEVVDDQISGILYEITVNPKATYVNPARPEHGDKDPNSGNESFDKKPGDNVSTYDTSRKTMYTFMMIVAVGGIYVLYKRRKTNNVKQ